MIKYFSWVVAGLLFLTACSYKESELETPIAEQLTSTTSELIGNEGSPPATVRFAVYDWQQAQYRELVQAFEEDNSDIMVELVSIEEALGRNNSSQAWPVDARVRLAGAADVLPVSAGQGTLEQGIMLDLQPLLTADNSLSRGDFYPNLLEQYEWDGGLWALPLAAEFTLIFYHKDAFDEAGLDYPQPGWTWADFVATAQALTVREAGEVVQWGFVQRVPSALEMIQAQTGPLFTMGGDLAGPSLDDPEVVNALRWYSDLFLTHKVAPFLPGPEANETGTFPLSPSNLIENGTVAMWTERSASWIWRSRDRNIGVAPFPITSPDDHSTPIHSEGLIISAGSQQPEAVWRWVRFLSQQSPATGLAEAGGELINVPARRSIAEASGFWDKVDSELATALKYALEHSYISLFATDSLFQEAAIEIIEEGQPVEEAIATAELRIEQVLTEVAATRAAVITGIVVTDSGKDSATEDVKTIVFTTVEGPGVLSSYRDLAQLFEENNPGVAIEVQKPDYSSGEVSTQDIAAYSDCFRWYPGFDEESRAAILPIEPVLAADPALNEDDFFPAIVEQFTYQGQLWGLPAEIAINMIEYNKTLFDASGVDYPALDWTTADFLAIAVALTEGEGEDKQYGFVPNVAEGSDIMDMLERMGARLLDESVEPPRITFDHPSVVDGIRWYASLTEYGAKPTLATNLVDRTDARLWLERQQLIDEGRAAMWSGNVGNSRGRGVEDNLGIVPLPLSTELREAGASDIFSLGYFISARTQAHQECWEWIRFISGQPAAANFGLPARRSVAESEAFRQQVGTEQAAAYLAALRSATRPSFYQRLSNQYAWLGISYVWLYQAYDQIIHEGAAAEEALGAVQFKADTYRNCIIDHEAHLRADDAVYQACLREADDSLPDSFYDTNE